MRNFSEVAECTTYTHMYEYNRTGNFSRARTSNQLGTAGPLSLNSVYTVKVWSENMEKKYAKGKDGWKSMQS